MTLRHWAVAGLVLAMAGCGSKMTENQALIHLRDKAIAEHLNCRTVYQPYASFSEHRWIAFCQDSEYHNIAGFGRTKVKAIQDILDQHAKAEQIDYDQFDAR